MPARRQKKCAAVTHITAQGRGRKRCGAPACVSVMGVPLCAHHRRVVVADLKAATVVYHPPQPQDKGRP
jgi:hypothetical protein